MVLNRDINPNQPMVDENPDTALQEAFNKGMIDTRERYRGMLFMYQDQLDQLTAKHHAEREVYRVVGKLELLKELFNMAARTKKQKILEEELVVAKEKKDGVKIPYVDWFRWGEPQMFG